MQNLSLPNSLRRGVGRRVLILLLVAAALPAMVTGTLAWFEATRVVKTEAAAQLRSTAKAYGVELFSRLERQTQKINQLVRISASLEEGSLASHAYLLGGFEAVALYEEDGNTVTLFGTAARQVESKTLDRERLSSGGVQFLVQGVGESARPFLVTALSPGNSSSLLVFQLRSDEFWRPLVNRQYASEHCVYDSLGNRLHCSDNSSPLPPKLQFEEIRRYPSTFESVSDDGEALFAASWQLFLDGAFGAPALDIVAYRPTAYALESGANFNRVLWPVLALMFVVVATLTYKTLDQSLTPLQQLTLAARQLAAGNLSSRARIRTDDEFGAVADAFNRMADRLGSQIAALEAMAEIDRLILSKMSLEDVAENVLQHVRDLTGTEAVAVIARKTTTPYRGRMVSMYRDEMFEDEVSLPTEVSREWHRLRMIDIDEVDESAAPYGERFRSFGQHSITLIPVLLDKDLKGVLLLGTRRGNEISQRKLDSCLDLAGRLAVALASVEREEELYRRAHFDELTGLPNRQLLADRLQQRLKQARRDFESGAILFMDLDRFKAINDMYGHSVGDVVLKQAAERIVAEVREADTVARLGGDEFVIILPNMMSEARVSSTAARLLARLSESFSVGGVDHYLGASIGIVMYPDDGDSVETLLKNADSAMYRAKDAGRARFEFFSKALNAASHRKIGLERDLRTAFNADELDLHYQPQFDIETGVISGAEALLRWTHSQHGPISPAEFVPLAEDSDLIVDIGRWVLRQACMDLRTILDQELHPGPVSINVSAVQLRDAGFVNDVLSALHDFSVHPGYLQLEVTETTVAENKDTAIGILNALRAHGVRVAIDDFGTGYSSLSYLQQMPFDVIKIDMSFVQLIGAGDPSDNICRTIIRMAHEMDKEVIAEGVETGEQARFLLDNGCNFVQGFYHAAAMPPGEFLAFIRKQDFHTQRRKALELVQA